MEEQNRNRTIGFALLLILAGFGILIHQLRPLPPAIDDVLISWQMLLILVGIYNLYYTQSRVAGYILIAIGGFFLLPELFDLPSHFGRNFWPLIIILVGILVLFRARKHRSEQLEVGNNNEMIDEVNIFSGSEKRIAIRNFRGGRITSIFGGSEIDLTGCELSPGPNVIEVFYLFGGSSITVPVNWKVHNRVTSILGGFSEKDGGTGIKEGETGDELTIRGMVIFGGGEIKRK